MEVHHIHPEAQGGPNTLDNAAPLCGSCHGQYGGNPVLRKQMREMRDHWWARCAAPNVTVIDAGLAEKLDAVQDAVVQGQKRQDEALQEVKNLIAQQLGLAQRKVLASGSLSDALSAASGAATGIGPVKVTMMLNTGLDEVEQDKVERLDGPISSAFIRAGRTDRVFIQGRIDGGRRMIEFRGMSGTLAIVHAADFLAATNEEAVAMVIGSMR